MIYDASAVITWGYNYTMIANLLGNEASFERLPMIFGTEPNWN
jgi:hypothetical protein